MKAQELPCDYLLLDTYTKGQYGGSGHQFDWDMIPPLSKPYFLAGGISKENVRLAMAHAPYCIDVSSAVETDGKKDREKMAEMVRAVRATEPSRPPLQSA
jgi:phosphoribosylanthranilate isomerase